TVLVASPSAIGSMPEASGSSVPAWPALSAWNSHFTLETASVEPMPTGLSSTSQPETGRPFFLPRRATICPPATGSRETLFDPSSFVTLPRIALMQVTRDFGRVKQIVDLLE